MLFIEHDRQLLHDYGILTGKSVLRAGAEVVLDRSIATYDKFAEKFETLITVRQLSILAGGPAALG